MAGVTRRPRVRGRRRGTHPSTLVALVIAVVGVAMIAIGPNVVLCGGVTSPWTTTYEPQTLRNAEFVGQDDAPYTDDEVQGLSEQMGLLFVPKFADNFSIASQMQQIRQLKAKAQSDGHPLQVFMYINTTYWFSPNDVGWAPYADGFDQSWLMKDASGKEIPFYGAFGTQAKGSTAAGMMVDLTDSAYRQFIVKIAQKWVEDAPIDGIVFDNADPLVGDQDLRASIAGGKETFNQLLCGEQATGSQNCPRVQAWNNGMTTLLSQVTKTLAPMDKKVLYNGVAPSRLRIDRNQALLDVTDGATNESFCYNLLLADKSRVDFTPMLDDIAMMQRVASQGKQLVEITNYGSAARAGYGQYCLAGFLMGWQPGSSFYVYHQGYDDPASSFPVLPEQNLDLGLPRGQFTQDGDLLSRSFDRGFVAVNTGTSEATFTAPRAGSQFADGELVGRVKAGGKVTLGARSAAFFLTEDSIPKVGSAFGVC